MLTYRWNKENNVQIKALASNAISEGELVVFLLNFAMDEYNQGPVTVSGSHTHSGSDCRCNMVIAQNPSPAVAENCTDYFDGEKYVTVVGYIAATRRYMSLTPAATLPFTFPFQERQQGFLKSPFDLSHGLIINAYPRASCCDFRN